MGVTFRDMMDAVKAFHVKMGVDYIQPMETSHDQKLEDAARTVLDASRWLEDDVGDDDKRRLRGHLCSEEPGEFLAALAIGDEVTALDALCDSVYVIIGTALTFDWPLEEAFMEVHRSNMTKRRKAGDPGRVRDKGESFEPPRIDHVLALHREGRTDAPLPKEPRIACTSPADRKRLNDVVKLIERAEALHGSTGKSAARKMVDEMLACATRLIDESPESFSTSMRPE